MTSFHHLPSAIYDVIKGKEDAVLLETSQPSLDNHHSYVFIDPVRVLSIHRASEVAGLLKTIQAYIDQGYYLAGYFGYECGYAMAKLGLRHYSSETQPLAWFGVYHQPIMFDHVTGQVTPSMKLDHVRPAEVVANDVETYPVRALHFDLDQQQYRERIERIKEYIRAGDTYQINFTGRYRFSFEGSPLALYTALKHKQPVPYAAYIRAAEQHILSFSPELFFRIDGQRITTRPMKGTTPRGRTLDEDRQRAEWLHNDAKNRAENIMIVDLLRNDLGRISNIGSVNVPELFTIERYSTLFQMTSTVEAVLEDDVDYYSLFQSLFPCGSVTGAPKLRSMEIIHELEQSPRGVYTGAIGYFAPSSDAVAPRRAVFNVAIRTIVLQNGHGEMGVGSGIVYDSVAAEEYAECAVKARFLTDASPDFDILEAVLWANGFQRMEQHLRRMADSATYFGYPFDEAAVESLLGQESTRFVLGSRYKVRLCLSRDGVLSCESTRLPETNFVHTPIIGVSAVRTDSQNRFYYHKTTNRALYNRASAVAVAHGYADIIFLNERGEVTEGATNNIFIERNGSLFTPPVQCGVLPGVYRSHILEHHPTAQEAILTLPDLQHADHIYICNAIRGWREVTLRPTLLDL